MLETDDVENQVVVEDFCVQFFLEDYAVDYCSLIIINSPVSTGKSFKWCAYSICGRLPLSAYGISECRICSRNLIPMYGIVQQHIFPMPPRSIQPRHWFAFVEYCLVSEDQDPEETGSRAS